MRAILTVGVSASGKSTWAANFVEEKKLENENWLVINQDEIRLAIVRTEKGNDINEVAELKNWDYTYLGEAETKMANYWEKITQEAIGKDYTGIIISDTNLDGGVKKASKLISYGIDPNNISIQEFSITFEEAVERDKNRKFSVGPDVLKGQFERLEALYEKRRQEASNKPKMKM